MLVTTYIQFIGLLVPSSTDVVLCLTPLPCLASQGAVAACSVCPSCAGTSGSTAISLCQLVHCLGFCSLFVYSAYFTMHAGIACLDYACWDSMFNFPDL